MSGSALTPSFLTSHRLQPCQGGWPGAPAKAAAAPNAAVHTWQGCQRSLQYTDACMQEKCMPALPTQGGADASTT